MNLLRSIILFIGTVVLLSACNDDEETVFTQPPVTPCSKVVIVYMMGENSLSNAAIFDLNEMQQGCVDIPSDCRLLVFIDNAALPRIYEYSSEGRCTLKSFSSEICSTDSAQMESVLRSLMTLYPAKTYGLVLWSHGSGWIPQHHTSANARQQSPLRTIGIDNNQNTLSKTGTQLNITALAGLLRHLPHFEFIYFDACFMQGIETAYELRNVTDYVFGSPAETPYYGAPYHTMMAPFFARPIEPQVVVDRVFEAYATGYGLLFSAVRCSELEMLATVTKPHVQTLFEGKRTVSTDNVQAYSAYCPQTYYAPEPFDMASFMHHRLSETEYTAWSEQLDKTVCVRRSTSTWRSDISRIYFTPKLLNGEPFGGISMFVPNPKYDTQDWNEDFRRTQWYRDAGWELTGW